MTTRLPALGYFAGSVPGRPRSWARTATAPNGRRVNPIAYRQWKANAAEHLAAHARWRTFPADAELSVAVVVHPDGIEVRASVLEEPARHVLTGDLDNYGKAALDALQAAGVLVDDAQVSVLFLTFDPGALPR